ncbi:MAG: flavin reductase family protein [Thaumarchaeota archaeon]|nr:flavin reductase family protein [Nitrososphaerota archaeon]
MLRKTVGKDRVHRLFYPVVPVLITSKADSRVGCMPAISCTPMSFNPLLIGVSISPSHSTHKIIEKSEHFAVNWLNHVHASKVAYMAEVSGREVADKISASGLTVEEGRASPTAIIKEAAAVIECAVKERHSIGDHDLFVGECLVAYAEEDFEDYWLFRKYVPMLYVGSERTVFRRKYVALKS